MSSSTFTPNLGIEQPATGMYANTWGTVANRSYAVLDAAIGGNGAVTLSGSPSAPQSLSTSPGGGPTDGLYPLIFWTGSQSTAGGVRITPATEQRLYVMANQTAAPITFSQSAGGTTFILQPGYAAQIYCDGGVGGGNANVAASIANPQFNNLLLTGNLQINGVVNAPSLGLGSPTNVPDPLTINGLGSGSYGQVRMIAGNYGVLLRNDGTSFYIMNTASGDQYGSWTAFPFEITLASGLVTLTALNTGAITASSLAVSGAASAGNVVSSGSIVASAGGQNTGSQADILFGSTGSGEGIGSNRASGVFSTDGLTFFTGSAARMYITNGGSVGIGIAPDELLTVNGWVHSTAGGFQFPDGTTQATAAVTFTMPQNPSFTTITVSGAATVGSMKSNGIVNATGYQINGVAFSPGIAGVTCYSGGSPQTGLYTAIGLVGSGVQVQFTGGSVGTWTITYNPSDSRVKRNIRPLEGGLSVINRLHPMQAEYNGLGGTRDGERVVNVMAEELQKIAPGAVLAMRRKLRDSDKEDTDLLYVVTQEILFQLVLAVQQISVKLGWSTI